MPNQASLFESPGGPESPSAPVDTRAAAGRQIMPLLRNMLGQVKFFIEGRGAQGATDEEIRLALDMRADTARARRCELRDARLVHDSGRRRPAASGRLAAVWISSSVGEVSDEVPAAAGPVSLESPMPPGCEASPVVSPIQPVPPATKRSEFYPCAYVGLSREK